MDKARSQYKIVGNKYTWVCEMDGHISYMVQEIKPTTLCTFSETCSHPKIFHSVKF